MGWRFCCRDSLFTVLLCYLMCCDVFFCKAAEPGNVFEENSDSLFERIVTIKMPGTRPLKRDTYLCTAVRLSPQKQYIVNFEPSASQETAHHMLLFGCSTPGADISSWDCKDGPYSECRSGQKILYAWAKNAPPKYLPKDVGFAVGGDSGIDYLVLQVHYASVDKFQSGAKDHSGFILHTRQQSLPYGGGIYLLWAYSASIPPETSGVHVDVACEYKKSVPMFAFAFRTHAHSLATVITGYRIRDGVWTLLGKGDPQAPQAFYPMKATFEIRKGDVLATRCTYDSKGRHLHKVVHMGASGNDEMCNFYIMYYSDTEHLQYSGGDCGEQYHDKIFKHFPADSDTPLEPQSPEPKATSSPVVSPSSGIPSKHTQRIPVVSPSVKLEPGGDDSSSRKSSTSSDNISLPTEAVTQNVAHMKVSPTGTSYKQTRSPPTKSQTVPDGGSVGAVSNPVIPVEKPTTTPQSHPSELHVVSNWPSLSALEKSKLGQVTGVSMDSKGRVMVFHRGSRIWDDSTFDSSNVFRNADIVGTISEHTVWIIDSVTGKVRGFWGKNLFYLPHGLTVDHEDNLWLTDVASHQVFKFSPLSDRTRRLLALGDKLVPGSDNSRFCKPTSVAVDKNGEFYVADGYCNSRIMKFSSSGKLLSKWGQRSYSSPGVPAPGTFFIPHGLALDKKRHSLYVADRENGRVQVFNTITSSFIGQIKLPEFGGLVYAVDYSDNEQGGVLHVINGPNKDRPIQGFTIRVSDGTLLQSWPTEKEQSFSQPHDVVSSVDGMEVYVVELNPNRVWKLSSKQQPVDVQSISTVSVVTNNIAQKSSHPSPKPSSEKVHTEQSHHGPRVLDLVEEKASLVPTDYESTTVAGSKNHSSGDGDVKSGNTNLNQMESIHHNKGDMENNLAEPVTKAPVVWVNVTEKSLSLEPTASDKNISARGPESDNLDSEESRDDVTAGVIPALVILSVLAVPIVFLLLISITLRVRAYHRDKHLQTNGFHGSRKNLSVGRTRGWWSYMNCCDRQKYKFNRVTLQDFYSDSDSDGV